MSRGILLRILAVAALLVAGMGLGVAPASAAPKPIGLSDDGIVFADHLPASLFGGVVIVPGHTATRSFWVKNRTTTPGNLAITLRGVGGADHELADALSMNAVVGSAVSPAIPLPAAGACDPLVSAVALAPDAIVRVDVTLGLDASLHAHATQGSLGAFNVGVTLTSTDIAAPDGCSSVTPPGSLGGGDGDALPAVPDDRDEAIVTGTAGGTLPDDADGGLPESCGVTPDARSESAGRGTIRERPAPACDGVVAAPVAPNPAGSFPWIALAACLIALVAGGIFAAWRRTRDRESRRS